MNAHLQQMIRCTDPNRRAKLAVQVQAQIEKMGREYLEVVEHQAVIVRKLLDAGLTEMPGSDEPISLEHITDEVGAAQIMGRHRRGEG